MKTKLLILFVCIFSFAAGCSKDEDPIEINDCHCRKMYYEQQTTNYSIQYVYTHRGEWEYVNCLTAAATMLQPSGYMWSNFNVIDDTHRYRWECE